MPSTFVNCLQDMSHTIKSAVILLVVGTYFLAATGRLIAQFSFPASQCDRNGGSSALPEKPGRYVQPQMIRHQVLAAGYSYSRYRDIQFL
jgi:hypothetical protein